MCGTMIKTNLCSGVGFLKLSTVVFGCLVSIIGLHSHFGSEWAKLYPQYCYSSLEENSTSFRPPPLQCPSIGYEIFFVVIITTALLISSGNLVIMMYFPSSESESEAERRIFGIVDAIYHSTYAILLLISGCTLIYSAAKIDQLVEDASATEDPADLESRKLLNAEKIVVGVLTFKLAVLYGVTSVTIFHRVKDVMYSNLLL